MKNPRLLSCTFAAALVFLLAACGEDGPPSSITYTIVFDSQGATVPAAPDVLTVVTPDKVLSVLPSPPQKPGYLFGGWFMETNGGGGQFSTNTEVSSDLTVFARWDSYSYSVRFDDQGATIPVSPTNMTVATPAYTVTALPAAPEKTGHAFEGWYTGTNKTGINFTTNTAVTGDITVYAAWRIFTFTVTYATNGALGGSAPSPYTGCYGEVTTAASNTGHLHQVPAAGTAEAFTMVSWNTAADGSGTTYAAGSGQFILTNDVTLCPVWVPFAVGGSGPAGGWICYDKGSFSGGWRYIEAAPSDAATAAWGTFDFLVAGADGTAAGTGRQNTLDIVNGDPLSNTAADKCRAYGVTNAGITFNDWYLPSSNELGHIWTNFAAAGGFLAGCYWSSTEVHQWSGYVRNFSTGAELGDAKTMYDNARPIRYF